MESQDTPRASSSDRFPIRLHRSGWQHRSTNTALSRTSSSETVYHDPAKWLSHSKHFSILTGWLVSKAQHQLVLLVQHVTSQAFQAHQAPRHAFKAFGLLPLKQKHRVTEDRHLRPICGMAFQIAVVDFPPPDCQSTSQAVTSERLATHSRHGRNHAPFFPYQPCLPPKSTSEASHEGGHTTLPAMIGRNEFSANWHGRPRCRQLEPLSCPSQVSVRNPSAMCVTAWQSLVSGDESSTGQQLVIVPK